MVRLIFYLSLLSTLTGCYRTPDYTNLLDSLIGLHMDFVVSEFGPPQAVYNRQDGSMVVEYMSSSTKTIGGYTYMQPQTSFNSGTASIYGANGTSYGTYSGTSTTYATKTSPKTDINLWCKTTFMTDVYGNVSSWRSDGNDCTTRSLRR